MKVLIVDDDALVLMATTAMVEDLGHDFTAVTSAAAALDALSSAETFELLITDFAMPHMNGLELATMVNSSHPAMPIIVATGYAFLTKDYSARYTLLQKPFTSEGLARAIDLAGVSSVGSS